MGFDYVIATPTFKLRIVCTSSCSSNTIQALQIVLPLELQCLIFDVCQNTYVLFLNEILNLVFEHKW